MAQQSVAQARVKKRSFLQQRVQRHPELGALLGFLVVFVMFSLLSNKFLTVNNLAGVLVVAAELGIIGIGVTFLMISGEFDLSVGSVMGVGGMTVAYLTNAQVPQLLGVIVALLFCAFIGWLNGTLTIRARIPSFIVTLGSLMLWRGLLFAVTEGFPITVRGEQSLLMRILNGRFLDAGFFASSIWFVVIGIIGAIILNKTKYGNSTFATGGDPNAARALGVNVQRVKLTNFTLSSVLAGFVGIIQFSRFSSVQPTMGEQMELQAIAAAVIGGSLLSGGYGSVVGTMIGAMLMGMIRSGLVLAGAPPFWYRAFIGVILVAAVIINTKARGK